MFLSGNEACVEGAILAGCRFFAGYPITPSTEIAEGMARRLPEVNGVYMQMEDEIASIFSVIGASIAGAKAMTATSGPGFSLMQEGISLAVMAEIPLVIVNVQRSGPSTGQPTLPSQQEIMQSRWGRHGDGESITLYPNSPQECLDLTVEAFNLAERYRVPVILLSDAVIAHMRENVCLRDFHIVERGEVEDGIEPMGELGSGLRIDGVSLDETGFPKSVNPEGHRKHISKITNKIEKNRSKIIKFEKRCIEGCEYLIISTGIASRVCYYVQRRLIEEGMKVGLFRPITIFPFPWEELSKVGEEVEKAFVVEMNTGQMFHMVRESLDEVELIPEYSGKIPDPNAIINKIKTSVR